MKHAPIATANAAAVTAGVVYIVCRILVGLFPDISFSIAQSWFHDIALTKLDTSSLTPGSFILGIVSSVITVWIIGYLFAAVYNYFLKAK